MDIVGRAKRIERKIARSFDAAVGELVGNRPPEPLEIVYRVLDRAEQEIQHVGRGQRVFPYTKVVVQLPVGKDRPARTRFAAVADGPPSLTERLQAVLKAGGCRTTNVVVDLAFVARPGTNWETPDFNLEFSREEKTEPTAPPPAPAVPARLKLTVVRGETAQRNYLFMGGRVDLGRRSEVFDAKHRLVRTNHVAFEENENEVNGSVSRRHAHIEYHAERHEYRLLDDRSAHGTGVVRNGRTIPVPSGSRGIRLEAGDEILLGQARLRVALVPPEEARTSAKDVRQAQ